MSLAESLSALEGRPLTKEEHEWCRRFEQTYEINDDDPLIVVVAMLVKNQLLLNQAPELLQQKARETIELHRQTLVEQSTLIAKQVLVTVGELIAQSSTGKKLRAMYLAAAFSGGLLVGLAVAYLKMKG
jgi:hypothetical protein